MILPGFSSAAGGRPGRGNSCPDPPDLVFVRRSVRGLILGQKAEIMGGPIRFSHYFSGVARHFITRSAGWDLESLPAFCFTYSTMIAFYIYIVICCSLL